LRHRRIGATDLVASEVGLPAAALVAGPDAVPDDRAAWLLRAALDLGVTYFAASDTDDDGRSERLLGEVVRGHRDEVTIATTFGQDVSKQLFQPAGAGPRHDWSPGFAGRALDRSLGRLRQEPVDLWLLHHPGMAAVESDELFAFLDQQVVKGKIRHYGVALGPGVGWAYEGVAALQERRVAAVETVYSVVDQGPGRELARVAAETGGGLVAREPLAPRLPPAARPRLEFLTRDRDRTLDQALLRFALADPAVATVLPATSDRDRLVELVAAGDLAEPTADDLQRVAELHEAGFGAEPEARPGAGAASGGGG
jgi:aryl-alcohol dehydrogenase-like predicted oxidoreductase